MQPVTVPTPSSAPPDRPDRHRHAEAVGSPAETAKLDLLQSGQGLLRPMERAHIRLVRTTLAVRPLDRAMRLLQRTVGQYWIRAATSRLRWVHGLDRLPSWEKTPSVLCVANHRSLFDLYAITAELVARGLPHRLLFPVRSSFFYDHPLGLFVNGVMSFFAMYPPIFRDKKRALLNLAGLDELARLLRKGGYFVGIHPEGTRNKGPDPYTLLDAQSGAGRLVYRSRAAVIPVFINGLSNDFARQIVGGITGRGTSIGVVFGAPIDFGRLLDSSESPRTFKAIADRCLEEIGTLGQEEKRLRASRGGT